MTYEPKTFDIPETPGISKETMDNHLNLYAGYVKHVNLIREAIAKERDNGDAADTYALSEMQRRLGFEFGGMKNHEYYFAQFEGGSKPLPDGRLKGLIESQWGSIDNWLERFKQIAKTRGVGWAMLYYDNKTDQLVQTWVDEQQLGQLADLDIVLALDMWEHSYMHDYLSSDKGKYIDAFFNCLNWEVVADRLA
jgi:Fe-Mn family superoxide dismutase